MVTWTSGADGRFCRRELAALPLKKGDKDVLFFDAKRLHQRIIGFGGAFTEAGAYVFANMPPELQDEFLWRYFGSSESGGNAYTLCRTHIQSCDFSFGHYAYVEPNDYELKTFSIDHDRTLLLPFIQCALALNPALELIASPWSPPAFMKTNRSMSFGGCLRPRCRSLWAQVLARYVKAYAAEGVRITRMTIQNESLAVHKWDTCFFTVRQECAFAISHLRPILDTYGFEDVKILAYDHDTDLIALRIKATMAHEGAPETYAGAAFHWYSGDHFGQIAYVARTYPELELIATEASIEPWRIWFRTPSDKAEKYGHFIIGQLCAGSQGFVDWNLLLDSEGGPNYAGNKCEAALMYNMQTHELYEQLTYAYIGHFSRFVRPGARRASVTGKSHTNVEYVGFVNPDSTRAFVAMNRTGKDMWLKLCEGNHRVDIFVPSHTIVTATWGVDELV